MGGQELTRDEVFALSGAFPVGSAKTLLSVARFPSWAVPETGYANAREFWAKVSEQLEAGVMPGGRVKILQAARDWFPANEKLAALAAAAAPRPRGPRRCPGRRGRRWPAARASRSAAATCRSITSIRRRARAEAPQAGLLASPPASLAGRRRCVSW